MPRAFLLGDSRFCQVQPLVTIAESQSLSGLAPANLIAGTGLAGVMHGFGKRVHTYLQVGMLLEALNVAMWTKW